MGSVCVARINIDSVVLRISILISVADTIPFSEVSRYMMSILKDNGVDYMVAPYNAWAQVRSLKNVICSDMQLTHYLACVPHKT